MLCLVTQKKEKLLNLKPRIIFKMGLQKNNFHSIEHVRHQSNKTKLITFSIQHQKEEEGKIKIKRTHISYTDEDDKSGVAIIFNLRQGRWWSFLKLTSLHSSLAFCFNHQYALLPLLRLLGHSPRREQ